jgi:hypothetical protein
VKLTALAYYAASVPTLFTMRNWYQLPWLWAGWRLTGQTFEVKLLEMTFGVETLMDVWTIKEVVMDRQYERTYQPSRGDVVVDIGAGVGDLSVMLSKRGCRVFAYEIAQSRIDLWRKNVATNEVEGCDLSTKPLKSLDEFFASHLTRKEISFVKIDCEGCEYPLMAHTSVKSLKRVRHMALEVHFFSRQQRSDYLVLLEKLKRAGFRITEVPNQVHTTISYLFADRG